MIRKVAEGTFAGMGAIPGTDTDWKVELWRNATEDVAITQLKFPYDQPLTIEWEEWKPEKSIQGSMATLKVESMTDREFINYYSTRAGVILLKVYRREWGLGNKSGWELVWNGALDPEFYEEPYSRNDGYDVTMTFSDFGTLDRIPYSFPKLWSEADPMVNLLDIFAWALEKGGLEERGENVVRFADEYIKWISTTGVIGWSSDWWDRSGNATINPDEPKPVWLNTARALEYIYVQHSNFFDEEDEPQTMREVLESAFMPLGFHIVQRGGKYIIYDTNGIFETYLEGVGDSDYVMPYIHWTADDQQLRTAETYNKVSITLSTYNQTDLYAEKVEPDQNSGKQQARTIKTYKWLSGTASPENNLSSFRILETTNGGGMEYVKPGFSFFKIYPINEGNDCTGVNFPGAPAYTTGPDIGSIPVLFSTKRSSYLPPMISKNLNTIQSQDNDGGNCLKLSMDLLLDPRYNPFTDADPEVEGGYNGKESYEEFKKFCGWVSIPCRILLRNASGKITHYYENPGCRKFNTTRKGEPLATKFGSDARWRIYSPTTTSPDSTVTLLQWYANKVDDMALNGWTTNRPAIGRWTKCGDIVNYLSKCTDGMYIPYPIMGGFIELQVLDGVLLFSRDMSMEDKALPEWTDAWYKSIAHWQVFHDVPSSLKWRMFRNIRIEAVRNVIAVENEPQDSDYLTEGIIENESAEPLELTFNCGTAPKPLPTIRAQYYVKTDERPLCSLYALKRAGRMNRPEEITMGSIISQYAVRRTVLSGEATETVRESLVYRDANTPELFVFGGSTLDCREGVEQISLIEIRPDEYAGKSIRNLKYSYDDSYYKFRPYEQHAWEDGDGSWGEDEPDNPNDDIPDWDDPIDPWDDDRDDDWADGR